MSEWTAEDVLRDSRRLRDGQPIGDTTLACLVDRICKYCDSFAARLEADALPVDDAAVREAVEQLTRMVGAMRMVGGYENTIQGAQTLYAAYRAACRKLDEALAEVERLDSWDGLMWILDAHWPETMCPTTRDTEEHLRDPGPRIVALVRWIDELRAEVERLTARVAELEERVTGGKR